MIDNRIYLASIFLRDNLLIFNHRDIQDILIISKLLTRVIYIRIGAGVDNIRHYVIIQVIIWSSHLYLQDIDRMTMAHNISTCDNTYRITKSN